VYSGPDEPYLLGGSGLAVLIPSSAASARSPRSGPGRKRLAVPGNHDAASRSHRRHGDDLCISERSGERVSACGGRPRRAREAHRAARRELGRLVCRLHGGGAVRQRAAAMNDSAGSDIAPGESRGFRSRVHSF
jgi:hypothetical protein